MYTIYPSQTYESLEVILLKNNIRFITDTIVDSLYVNYLECGTLRFIDSRIINVRTSNDLSSAVIKKEVDNNIQWLPGGISGSIQFNSVVQYNGISNFLYNNNILNVLNIKVNSDTIVKNINLTNASGGILNLFNGNNLLENYSLIFPESLGVTSNILMLKQTNWLEIYIPFQCNKISSNTNSVICVGTNGIIYSNDLINWNTLSVINWNNIVWNNYLENFCIVNNANIMLLNNNIEVITIIPILNSVWKNISWNNDLYQYLITSNNFINISNDGILWNTYIFNIDFNNILWSTKYHSYIGITDQYIYISDYGILWESVYFMGSNIRMKDIIETDRILIVGYPDICINEININEWETVYISTNTSIEWNAIIYSTYYFVGNYKSNDGLIWEDIDNNVYTVYNFVNNPLCGVLNTNKIIKYVNDLRLQWEINTSKPNGDDYSLQYNDNGSFNGIFHYNNVTKLLSVTNIITDEIDCNIINTYDLKLGENIMFKSIVSGNPIDLIFPTNYMNNISTAIKTDGGASIIDTASTSFVTINTIAYEPLNSIQYNDNNNIRSTTNLYYDNGLYINGGIQQESKFLEIKNTKSLTISDLFVFNDYLYTVGNNILTKINVKNNLDTLSTTTILNCNKIFGLENTNIIIANNLLYQSYNNNIVNTISFTSNIVSYYISSQYIYVALLNKLYVCCNFITVAEMNFLNITDIFIQNSYLYLSTLTNLWVMNINNNLPTTISFLNVTSINNIYVQDPYIYTLESTIFRVINNTNKYSLITVFTQNSNFTNISITNNYIYLTNSTNLYVSELSINTVISFNTLSTITITNINSLFVQGNTIYVSNSSTLYQINLKGFKSSSAEIGNLTIGSLDILNYLNLNGPLYTNNIYTNNNINTKQLNIIKNNIEIESYTSVNINSYAGNIYLTNSIIIAPNSINFITITNNNVSINSIIKTSIIQYEHGFPQSSLYSIANNEFIIKISNVSDENTYGKLGISFIVF